MAKINSEEAKFEKEKRYQRMQKRLINMDRTNFTFRVPTNVMKRFKRKLLEDDLKVTDFLNRMILNYIEKG